MTGSQNSARFVTDDLEQACRYFTGVYCNRVESIGRNRHEFHVTAETIRLELLTVHILHGTGSMNCTIHNDKSYTFIRMEEGVFGRSYDGRQFYVPAGRAILVPEQSEGLIQWEGDCNGVSIQIPASAIQRKAERLIAEPLPDHRRLELDGMLNLTAPTLLGQELEFLLEQLQSNGSLFDDKYRKLREAFQRAIIQALIEDTPNNYQSLLAHRYGGAARRYASKFDEYIEEHIELPVGIVDIAATIGCSARTLRNACWRVYDESPETRLRRKRLHRAHARLENPLPEDTVDSIARESGFVHLGRFAQRYQQEFQGELPRETLREGRRKRGIVIDKG